MHIYCMNSNYIICDHTSRRNGLTMFTTRVPLARDVTQAETGSGRLRPFVLTLARMLGYMILSRTAQDKQAICLPPFAASENKIIWLVLASGIVSVIVGALWYSQVNSQ